MSDSHENKIDKLLSDAVELRPQPDFAKWCLEHPQAVDALTSLPITRTNRRSKVIRITRYSTSAAAVLIFLAAGAWWMLLSHGARNAWAEAIEQLAQIRSATCSLHTHRGGHESVSKAYLEGSRVRVEDTNRFNVTDFLEGKYLWAENSTMTAVIGDMKKDSGELFVLGSNPPNDLMQMKNAPAERLPDEHIGDTLYQVYRVKDTAFMGYKVPWVKLWLDPDSKLPVQIHSVVVDRIAMTFNDFRWNEPFDKDLLSLVVPKGYKLVPLPGNEEAPKAVAPPLSSGAAPKAAGREIPTDEIAKTLDMLGQRIEANYKAIKSWSGTFDVTEIYRHTRGTPYEQTSHSEVQFFAEPGQDRIRINNRAVEPVRIVGDANITPARELPESRWVITPKESFRFFVDERRHRVKGFPHLASPNAGKGFRVLYREPPKAAEQYSLRGCINPLSFFGNGRPSWKNCYLTAEIFRGEHGSDNMEYVKKNAVLRVRPKGADTEYIFTQRFKPVGSGHIFEWVFSSQAGFNVVSREVRQKGQLVDTQHNKFRKEKGVFIPYEVEINRYDNRSSKDSKRLPTQHYVYTLKQTQVNEPIDPAVFEISSLGLQDGDRMIDLIENQTHVFDGKKFQLVPAENFKRRPERDNSPRAHSTNLMKQIALGMHVFHDTRRRFPARAVFDKDGKPLLSWRVLLLPYLQEGNLYKQFHLDEPWDSPHNKKLIERMPAAFRSPASKAPANTTTYLVPVGPGSLFEGNKGVPIREIRDGTSNTLMLVEANDDQAVIWTKPDDFEYDQQDPMCGLIGSYPDGFLAGLADGSVRFVRSSVDPTVLKAFFTHNGGEKVSLEALEQ